jgi:hypothetical protein
MAEIDAGRQRAAEFTQRFIDSGCDPRSLSQQAFSHADGNPPRGLDEAIAQADLIVTGRITNTRFINGEPFNPSAESTLAVDLTVKGTASSQITLVQSGGPVPSSDGGAIGHLEGDPVLLAGDQVILFAKKQSGTDAYVGLYPVGK